MGNVILTGQSGSGGGGIDFEGTIIDTFSIPDTLERYQFIKPVVEGTSTPVSRVINTYGNDSSSPYTGQTLSRAYHLGGTRYLQFVNIYASSLGLKVRIYDISNTDNTNTSLGYTLGFTSSGTASDNYEVLIKDGLVYVFGLTSTYSRFTWWVFSIPETGNTPVLENTGYITNSLGYYMQDLTPVDGFPNKYLLIQKASGTASDYKASLRLIDINGTNVSVVTTATYSGNVMYSETARTYLVIGKVGTDPSQYMLMCKPTSSSIGYLPFRVTENSITYGTMYTESTLAPSSSKRGLRLPHSTNQLLHYLYYDVWYRVRTLTVEGNVVVSASDIITTTGASTNTTTALNREYMSCPLSNNTFLASYSGISSSTPALFARTYIAVVTPKSIYIYEYEELGTTGYGSYSGSISKLRPDQVSVVGDTLVFKTMSSIGYNDYKGGIEMNWVVKPTAIAHSFIGAHGLSDKNESGKSVMLIPN